MLIEHIFLINLFCSVFMTGLIWTIQLVQYPSFSLISPGTWKAFHQHHTQRIDKIVIPVMSAELATSGALFWFSEGYLNPDALGFYIVILIWISTGLFSVPAHYGMSEMNEEKWVRRLVKTNWIRTILWSLKSIVGYSVIV
jgi:hypothetical protein